MNTKSSLTNENITRNESGVERGGGGARGRARPKTVNGIQNWDEHKVIARPITASPSIRRAHKTFSTRRLIQSRSDKGAYASVAFPLIHPLGGRTLGSLQFAERLHRSAVIGNIFLRKSFCKTLLMPSDTAEMPKNKVHAIRSPSFAPLRIHGKWMEPKSFCIEIDGVCVCSVHSDFVYVGSWKWEKMCPFRFGVVPNMRHPAGKQCAYFTHCVHRSLPCSERGRSSSSSSATRCTLVSRGEYAAFAFDVVLKRLGSGTIAPCSIAENQKRKNTSAQKKRKREWKSGEEEENEKRNYSIQRFTKFPKLPPIKAKLNYVSGPLISPIKEKANRQ